MATDVQVFDGSAWIDVDYSTFRIVVPTSAKGIAPSAEIQSRTRESINPGQDFRIVIDGTTRFGGETTSGGELQANGEAKVKVKHPAVALFAEQVTLDETAATDEDVLKAALDAATRGSDFSLDYTGDSTTLGNDYSVENRPVKQVFRDMMDRTSRVWWVDPAETTIHVEPLGDRGTWKSIDTQSDSANLQKWTDGSVDAVRNDVTVVGTGKEKVTGSAQDSDSIDDYGRRSKKINVEYITSDGEAEDMAEELLIPDPLGSGKLLVGQSTGTVEAPLVNYTVDVTDTPKGVDESDLVIEEQKIKQGRAELSIGEGSGVSLENVNRDSRSRDDKTAAGSVWGEDNIGDDSISENKIRDSAITGAKIEDGVVTAFKLADGSVLESKIDTDAISETNIQDDAIETPKLAADAVQAPKIDTATITGEEFERIVDGEVVDTENIISLDADKVVFADADEDLTDITGEESDLTVIEGGRIRTRSIDAEKIETDTITADEIDTLDLETEDLSIGTDGDEQLVFDLTETADGTLSPQMYPTTSETGTLGGEEGGRLYKVYSKFIECDSISARGGLSGFQGPDADVGFQITDDGTDTVVEPDENPSCLLGSGDGTTMDSVWQAVHTQNLYEYSPEPLSPEDPRFEDDIASDGGPPVDLEELKNSSWGDPPEYASQRKMPEGEYEALPEREDGTKGVEMGHLLNLTFEGLKEVIREKERLEDRVEDLEARLSKLEGQNA